VRVVVLVIEIFLEELWREIFHPEGVFVECCFRNFKKFKGLFGIESWRVWVGGVTVRILGVERCRKFLF